jgi:glycosyltransferase involved in cell wall biosynthesis
MKILHVISAFGTGGAEMMLLKLLTAMDSREFSSSVLTLLDRQELQAQVEALGVTVINLGLRGIDYPRPTVLARLVNEYRRLRPDLVQGWMYHGNLAAWAGTALGFGSPLVCWNIRHSLDDLRHEKWATRMVIRAGGILPGRLNLVLYNSETARRQHARLGYDRHPGLVIANGFDTDQFSPQPSAGAGVRQELGLRQGTPLVGMIARRHPMKDHEGFLKAAALVVRACPGTHFLLAGAGVGLPDTGLRTTIEQLGLSQSVHLLGLRQDTARLNNGLDVAVLSSAWGEAFPNVVGEAMACGKPCVVTDVGDARLIVGETGLVAPPRDPQALAGAIISLLTMDRERREELGRAARKRIVEEYSLTETARRYERVYRDLARKKH